MNNVPQTPPANTVAHPPHAGTALLSLLQLSDPALPIGAYAHSGGLETYVQAGTVLDPATAREYITQLLSTSIHYTDAALLALTHKNPHRLEELNQLAEAVKQPKEIREASRLLGRRLLTIFTTTGAIPTRPEPEATRPENLHYAIAFGYCAAALNIDLEAALTGFYYNAAAAMVTNCVKLIPIGQQDGQKILFGLHLLIQQLTEKSKTPDEQLIGLCCTGLDIRCMQHETLYSRLYMS
jgi:urease accessory protein